MVRAQHQKSCHGGSSTDTFLDDVFLRQRKIDAIERPTKHNQNSVWNVINETRSIVTSEAKWIRQTEDLAALGCRAGSSWLNGMIERVLLKCPKNLVLVSSWLVNLNKCVG